MFGRQTGVSNAGGNSANLIEFRAGRMNMVGSMVHPDSRKGMVYMTQNDDGLMHFCWKDRTTGKVEDDLIVFPDDFEYKRVNQCTTGRVYVLKFKSSSRRMFFWMQEPKTDRDEEFCRRVNELLNNPPPASRSNQDGDDFQYMINNMSQQQLMQLFGGVGQIGGLTSILGSMNRNSDSGRSQVNRSTTNADSVDNSSTTVRASSTPKVETDKSSDANGGTNTTAAVSDAANTNSGNDGKENSNINASSTNEKSFLPNLAPEAGSGRSLNIDLTSTLVDSEEVNDLIADSDRANQLSIHLPPAEDADINRKQQIKETIASPQFQQALSVFSRALQAAQLGSIVSQFELTTEAVAAAHAGNLEDFVKALEKALPVGVTMTQPASTSAARTTEDKDKSTEAKSNDGDKQNNGKE